VWESKDATDAFNIDETNSSSPPSNTFDTSGIKLLPDKERPEILLVAISISLGLFAGAEDDLSKPKPGTRGKGLEEFRAERSKFGSMDDEESKSNDEAPCGGKIDSPAAIESTSEIFSACSWSSSPKPGGAD